MLELVVNNDLTTEEMNLITHMMQYEEGIRGIFFDKLSRFYSASVIALIKLDNIPIGFLMALSEQTNNMLFLDLGIKSDYRGKGYGTIAKKIFLEKYNGPEFIFTEVKDTNIGANMSSSKIGTLVYQTEDGRNFYLLNKSVEELYESGTYNDLVRHTNWSR